MDEPTVARPRGRRERAAAEATQPDGSPSIEGVTQRRRRRRDARERTIPPTAAAPVPFTGDEPPTVVHPQPELDESGVGAVSALVPASLPCAPPELVLDEPLLPLLPELIPPELLLELPLPLPELPPEPLLPEVLLEPLPELLLPEVLPDPLLDPLLEPLLDPLLDPLPELLPELLPEELLELEGVPSMASSVPLGVPTPVGPSHPGPAVHMTSVHLPLGSLLLPSAMSLKAAACV